MKNINKLISYPALCNTNPELHYRSIVEILMKYDVFTPELSDEIGAFINKCIKSHEKI